MFAKAKLKRFNEEVGCAPPPTAYDPKSMKQGNFVSLDKCDRWKENKEVTPAPNAYNNGVTGSRTPGRALPRLKPLRPHNRTSSALQLNLSTVSSCSSTASNTSSFKEKFVSPLPLPRLARTGSCRAVTTERQQALLLQQLRQERDALQATVLRLEEQVACLQEQLAACSAVPGQPAALEEELHAAAVDTGAGDGSSTCTSELEHSLEGALTEAPSSLAAVSDDGGGLAVLLQSQPTTDATLSVQLVQEQICHLTQLRDNLEACVARKDEIISQLQLECDHLAEESKLRMAAIDRCHLELKGLENTLSESLYSGSGDTVCQSASAESVVGRVAGLVMRYEVLLHTHTAHTDHCTLQIHSLNETLAALNGKMLCYEVQIGDLQKDAIAKVRKICCLEETVSEMGVASKEKEMMETMMQEEIRQRNQEMSMLEEGYTSLEQKVAEAEQRAQAVAAEQAKREAAETMLGELWVMVREAEVLQQFLEKEVLARDNEISCCSGKIEELSSELNMARQVALDLQEEAEAQLNQVLALKASLAAKDYDVDERDEKIIALKEEIVSQQELVSDLQDVIVTHKTGKASLAKTLGEAITQLEEQLETSAGVLVTQTARHAQTLREKEVEICCIEDLYAVDVDDLKETKAALHKQVGALRLECDSGQEGVQRLKDKLAESDETVKRLEEKIVELMAEVEDYEMESENKVSSVQSELDELSTQYSESLLETDATRRVLSHTVQQLQQTQLLQEAAEGHLEQVKGQLSTVQANLSSKSDECTSVELSFKELAGKFTSMEEEKAADSADKQELIRRLQCEVQQSVQGNAALQQELQGIQSSNAGFMTQIQQLRQDLGKKSAAVEESKECIELLREEKRVMTAHSDQLEAEGARKAAQLQELQENVAGKVIQLREMTANAEDLQKQVELKHDKITDINTQFEREMQRMREDKDETMLEREKAEQEKMEQHQREFLLQQRIEELTEQIADVVELKDDFAIKVVALEKSVEDLTEAASCGQKVEAQLYDMRQHNTNLQAELSASLSCQKTLQCEVSELGDVRAALYSREEGLAALQDQCDGLLDAVQVQQEERAALQSRLQELECEGQQCRGDGQAAAEELSKLRALHGGRSCDEDSALRAEELGQRCKEAEAATEEWRARHQQLEQLVEPFREQLERYESERATLQGTQSAARQEASELSRKYTALLGHQNHKQKIHHVVKLKTENTRLIEEVTKLRVESDRHRKTLQRLEDKLQGRGGLGGEQKGKKVAVGGKENSGAMTPLKPSNKQQRL